MGSQVSHLLLIDKYLECCFGTAQWKVLVIQWASLCWHHGQMKGYWGYIAHNSADVNFLFVFPLKHFSIGFRSSPRDVPSPTHLFRWYESLLEFLSPGGVFFSPNQFGSSKINLNAAKSPPEASKKTQKREWISEWFLQHLGIITLQSLAPHKRWQCTTYETTSFWGKEPLLSWTSFW